MEYCPREDENEQCAMYVYRYGLLLMILGARWENTAMSGELDAFSIT